MSEVKSNDWSLNLVIAASVLSTIVLLYLAFIGNKPVGLQSSDVPGNQTVSERIRPVMTLNDIISDKATPDGDVQVAVKTPEELYNGACMACHLAGVANAPKLGDKEAWAPRKALGLDALLQTAITGKGAMPPKGASSYSDDELRSVIEYMLEKAS